MSQRIEQMQYEVKALWQICFDDEPAFVDLYFAHRYAPERNMAVCRDGHVVSALQMLPYEMTYGSALIRTSYISGACTHPDYRRKGVMGELLAQTHRRMHADGVALATLIPANAHLYTYYHRFGYVPLFFRRSLSLSDMDPLPRCESSLAIDESYTPEVYAFFRDHLLQRPMALQHDEQDMQVVMAGLQQEGCRLGSLRGNNGLEAIAFYTVRNMQLVVHEAVGQRRRHIDLLLTLLAEKSGAKELDFHVAADRHGEPFGMGRVIDVPRMLQLYAAMHREVDCTLCVVDPVLQTHEVYYRLLEGRSLQLKASPTDTDIKKVGIGELTSMLFADEKPYMSLMLD